MITRYLLPVLALAGLVFAVIMAVRAEAPQPVAAAIADPARPPYDAYVAGAGLIEARTENVAIGTPVAGLVTAVHVTVGDSVGRGNVLFEIDDRALAAELLVARATADRARAQFSQLASLPRPENVPPAQARLDAARADLEDMRVRLAMAEAVDDPRAVSAENLAARRFAAKASEARVAEQQAELSLLQAGAWEPDLAAAQAEVAAAEARIPQGEVELDRLKVRAPADGQLLQVKVRAGEYAPAGVMATPLMLLGDVARLHVRVDVDENDAWRVRAGAPAVASARGNKELSVALGFVRFEPYIVPKRSLTGESTERVDTRVLQVLYAFDRGDLPLYVGQQMDVFIEAPPLLPVTDAAAPAAPAAPGAAPGTAPDATPGAAEAPR
jgi:HlyD family secretion protein